MQRLYRMRTHPLVRYDLMVVALGYTEALLVDVFVDTCSDDLLDGPNFSSGPMGDGSLKTQHHRHPSPQPSSPRNLSRRGQYVVL
jgi:hypothetical protein